YPCLLCMAWDYLTIATSIVDVKQLFSCGHLLLTHVQSSMSSQSTWALLCCVGCGVVHLTIRMYVECVSTLADVMGNNEEMPEGWNYIDDQVTCQELDI
ncbi:hypothetical protein L210DRAFT_845314, partial [Boletus edulis BED1]